MSEDEIGAARHVAMVARLRDRARADARRHERWLSYVYVAIVLSAALWVVVEAAIGALTRAPA